MKAISRRLLNCCAAIMLIAGSDTAMADAYQTPQMLLVLDQSTDDTGSFCLDSMETVPFADELMPIPVAVDGGCSMPEGTIAT